MKRLIKEIQFYFGIKDSTPTTLAKAMEVTNLVRDLYVSKYGVMSGEGIELVDQYTILDDLTIFTKREISEVDRKIRLGGGDPLTLSELSTLADFLNVARTLANVESITPDDVVEKAIAHNKTLKGRIDILRCTMISRLDRIFNIFNIPPKIRKIYNDDEILIITMYNSSVYMNLL